MSLKRVSGTLRSVGRAFSSSAKTSFSDGKTLADFVTKSSSSSTKTTDIPCSPPPYLENMEDGNAAVATKSVFIERYGCQMNFQDAEVVLSVLQQSKARNSITGDFVRTTDINEADIVLVMTCAIRENAEGKIWNRIDQLGAMKRTSKLKTVGILGCMAERLKEKIFDMKGNVVDVIAGPDAYRDLPRLLDTALTGQRGVNVMLSLEETYADIAPVRLDDSKHSAFVSIMRGCNNMCAFCIVPFTRGRERSRPIHSIIDEVKRLSDEGVREIILLGQNVNSYHDKSGTDKDNITAVPNDDVIVPMSRNFKTIYRPPKLTSTSKRFVNLLDTLSAVDPNMRIRFTSPHPKDFPDGLLQLMRDRHNICKQIHLPVQSGSSAVLDRMRRGYTREAYLELVQRIREIIPDAALSSDFIVGFCGETEEDHQLTLDIMRQVGFQMAYMFAYSMRAGTMAHRRYTDDVPLEVKQRRLQELIDLFYAQQVTQTQTLIETRPEQVVLIEGFSKKSDDFFQGKIDNGRTVIFPIQPVSTAAGSETKRKPEVGDYVSVKMHTMRGTTPIAEPIAILSSL